MAPPWTCWTCAAPRSPPSCWTGMSPAESRSYERMCLGSPACWECGCAQSGTAQQPPCWQQQQPRLRVTGAALARPLARSGAPEETPGPSGRRPGTGTCAPSRTADTRPWPDAAHCPGRLVGQPDCRMAGSSEWEPSTSTGAASHTSAPPTPKTASRWHCEAAQEKQAGTPHVHRPCRQPRRRPGGQLWGQPEARGPTLAPATPLAVPKALGCRNRRRRALPKAS
mmetsp:Transcript_132926/g.315023  ORF Transcript_132926/g.315023 Transcript_132926/m.315023 type:complete len:225 (+) Transcript_132926:287-961(+)